MDMQTGWNENRALLRGTAAAEPVVSHESHGVVYETFPLTVLRLSGSEDRINVLAPRPLLAEQPVTAGMALEVEGEVRSFNNKSGKGSRLVITLYAKALRPWEGEDENQLLLAGVLAGILLCYPVYLSWQAELAQRTNADLTLNAGLWLALNQTPLFRLLCPMTFQEMAASLLLLLALPVWACDTGWRIAGRHWIRGGILSLSTAVCWALVFRGRLTEAWLLEIPSLIVLAALVILMAADSLWLLHRGDI